MKLMFRKKNPKPKLQTLVTDIGDFDFAWDIAATEVVSYISRQLDNDKKVEPEPILEVPIGTKRIITCPDYNIEEETVKWYWHIEIYDSHYLGGLNPSWRTIKTSTVYDNSEDYMNGKNRIIYWDTSEEAQAAACRYLKATDIKPVIVEEGVCDGTA